MYPSHPFHKKPHKKRRWSIRQLCCCGLFTAWIALLAQITIPTPLGIPFTLQTFAVTLTAILLGARLSSLTCTVYLLLGAAGLPVFGGFSGGLGRFAGPTGGFLLTFPLMAFLIGLGAEHRRLFRSAYPLALFWGALLNHLGGVLVFHLVTGSKLSVSITVCVLPFLPTTLLQLFLATVIGFSLRRRLAPLLQNLPSA